MVGIRARSIETSVTRRFVGQSSSEVKINLIVSEYVTELC
jgi:hypothetical protein